MGEDIKVVFDEVQRKPMIVWKTDVDLKSLSSFETITRCRREIQNHPTEPLYLPTDPEVATKRGIRQEAVRAYYAKDRR